MRGADGPVVVPLFTTPRTAAGFASGTVTVTDPALLAALRSDPGSFYTDLRTAKFPGGVARAPCDPQATPVVNVPYQADYVFING